VAHHGVPIIEDAAEALGASHGGKAAGSFGTVGVFSFNGNKIVTTSGGGMLVSDDKSLTDRARSLATQARDDKVYYEHSAIGYNYRLSNLLAAVGRGQLIGLEEKIARRRAINATYRDALADLEGITFLPQAPGGEPNHWLTVITIDADEFGSDPFAIAGHLETLDIEARPAWKPMHLQPIYHDAERRGGAVAERLFATGLCLPSGSSLTDAEQARVIEALHGARGLGHSLA
jgi:dTDP-4-amino-4,6-dideoxygalactose transaminase